MTSPANASDDQAPYPQLASPCQVGPVRLPNRVAFPAWQVNYATTDGTVSDKLTAFYSRLAAGGCGLIFTGCAVVSSDGVPFDKVMRIDQDEHVPALRELLAMIKDHGSVPGIQLVHYGRQSSTSISGDTLMAPSAIPCPVMSQYDPEYRVREMTREEVDALRQAFIAAARRAAEAGVEVVEIHAAHGYMLNEFLSPYSNKRTDDYGGSTENRARLIVEIVAGVRSELDGRVAIAVRVSGDEFVAGGLRPDDYAEIIPLLEGAGMDLLHVSAGVYESMERIVPPETLGETPHVGLAEQIKRFTNLPVCAVGSIYSLATAEQIIADGRADLCAMGRAQVADPEIVKKSFAGREDEIRECTRCNSCTFWTTGDPEMYCTVNPDYQRPFMMMGQAR